MENVFTKPYYDIVNKMNNLSEMTDDDLLLFYNQVQETHEYFSQLQLVVKRNGNSLYGVSASQYFSLHDTDMAEDITVSAKHFAIIVDRAINNFFVTWADNPDNLKIIQEFYPNVVRLRNFTEYVPDTKDDLCCYGDTDSRYINLAQIYNFMFDTDNNMMQLPHEIKEVSEFSFFLDKNFISKIIAKTIQEDCEKRNARQGYLKMNHEVTTFRSILLKKKKYIMSSIQSDYKIFDKPKLKFKGVELKRGSMSEKAKKIIAKLVDKYILENYTLEQIRLELLKIIKYIKIKRDINLIYQISSVSGLDMKKNDAGVWVSDKTHIQMQVALSWMNFIEQNKLNGLYRPAFEGQKMSYYYCAENTGYKVMGIPDDIDFNDIQNLPEPDWNKMIQMTIVKPVCRYIIDKPEIDDKDIEVFLLGLKVWNFK